MSETESCKALLALIGQQIIYQKHHCEIIEVLDGCQLVLQVLQNSTSIQATQYGEGHRNVPLTYTLSVFDAEGNVHPEFESTGLTQYLPDNS